MDIKSQAFPPNLNSVSLVRNSLHLAKVSTGLERGGRGGGAGEAHQFHQEREIMSQQNNNHNFWPQVEKVALQKSKPFLFMNITMVSLAVLLKKTNWRNKL